MIDLLFSDNSGNRLDFSTVTKFEQSLAFRQFAIKYVISGRETYHINDKLYVVNEGEYLVGNNLCKSQVKVDKKTSGLCIDLSVDLILELAKKHFNQSDFETYLLNHSFFIGKYNLNNSLLVQKLMQIAKCLPDKQDSNYLKENLYSDLGETFVLEQILVFEQLSRLKYSNYKVSHENFRRLNTAKEFMDNHFLTNLHLDQIARIACMSMHRFVRQFKNVFDVSPYQYLLQKRLDFSKSLLLQGRQLSEVAFLTGFSDPSAFSKAFKNKFSVTPTIYIQKAIFD